MKMTFTVSLLILLSIVSMLRAQSQLEIQHALADRAKNFPNEDDWDYIFYVSMFPSVGEDAKQLRRAIKLVIASDSVQPVIERCAGVDVGEGLLRFDLRDLDWRVEDWYTVAYRRNPYANEMPLVVRADWLLLEMSDLSESDTYNLLISKGKGFKTRDDVFKFFRVGNDAKLNYGIIEGKSGVSVTGRRRIESRPVLGTGDLFVFRTEDVEKLTNERDAIENPTGNSPFDAEEGIIAIFKMSAVTGDRGLLQWYYLANGLQKIIDRADPRIVTDTNRCRGFVDIHNPCACILCHAEGLKDTTRNQLRYLKDGKVPLFLKEKNIDIVEAALLSNINKPIRRYQDSFQTMVELACNADSKTVATNFNQCLKRYDADLNLEQTASELDVIIEEWGHTIGVNGTLPANLSALVADIPVAGGKIEHGTVPRAAWEQDFIKAYSAVHGGPPIKEVVKKLPVPPPKKPTTTPTPKKQPQPQQSFQRRAA